LDDVAALALAFSHRRVPSVHNFHSFDLHFQQADGDNDGGSLGSLLSDSSKTLNINTGFRLERRHSIVLYVTIFTAELFSLRRR
jgi:hypothetical protein